MAIIASTDPVLLYINNLRDGNSAYFYMLGLGMNPQTANSYLNASRFNANNATAIPATGPVDTTVGAGGGSNVGQYAMTAPGLLAVGKDAGTVTNATASPHPK